MGRFFFASMLSAVALHGQGQPLLDPDSEAAWLEHRDKKLPLVLREAADDAIRQSTVQDAIAKIRTEMREIAQAALTEAQRKEALRDLYRRNARVLRKENTEQDAGHPRTVDEAVLQLEILMYQAALEAAPDEAARKTVIENAPRDPELEPDRPILIAPAATRSKIVVTRDAEAEGLITPWWKTTRFDSEALDLEATPKSPEERLEPPAEKAEAPGERTVAVEVLADEKTTVEMHDDVTILRDVQADDGALVLFDALHLWAGGAVQYDFYHYEGLLNAAAGGGSEQDTAIRRGEVVLRSTLYDLGEAKLQYDLDAEIWRDLYYRLADSARAVTLTLGNQTEPFSQENILGNKFNVASELAAPSSTFGSYRGMGVTLNRWFTLGEYRSLFGFETLKETAVTAAIGLYGEDIEDTNDTDMAITGRVTAGRLREDGSGLHLGVSGTWRDGEFDRIAPRPEIAAADRIVLAHFDANRATVLGLEALYTKGALHASSEVFLADYRDGEVDAQGLGGFLEVGYYLTGQERRYRPKWGLWAPLQVGARNILEIFGRLSYTYGDSDAEPSNDLRTVTVGGSWYRHKLRASINLVYAATDRSVSGEDGGVGASLRLQYLF